MNRLDCAFIVPMDDVSPENEGSLKVEYDGGFGGLARKERTHEAVEVFRGTDCVRDPTGRSRHPVGDLCRQLGVSDATFYAWKKKYAHLGVSELRRLRQLEEENSRLKRLVADLSLDKHMLSEALRKTV